MDISKFNNTLLYSNKNVEKLARKLINESANAVLMEMFEDKCVFADHTTGNIYESKYSFDGNVFSFDNFEQITFESNNDNLKEAISNYFDDSLPSLTEAYEQHIAETNSDVFEDSLAEALASKNMDEVVDYTELAGISEEVSDFRNSSIYRLYEERINKAPLSNVKIFDWKHPVKVALIDEDVNKVLNKSVAAKAKRLKTSAEFKKAFMEAAKDAVDGSNGLMEDLLEKNQALTALSKADLKEIVGFSVIGDKSLMEKRNEITDIVEGIIENSATLTEAKNALTEENTHAKDDKDPAPEATEQDCEAIKKALETAKSKATDEKLINKIDDLISSIDSAANVGETDVGAVKEAISLLSL